MKNLIIITSVINISKAPLDYTETRSVFSSEERYNQTLKTIESCDKIKDKHILLIETSEISKDKEDYIKNNTDYYFNFKEDKEIKNNIDGKYKSIAEGTQIHEALKRIDIFSYENIIKISGRYWFSENFDYENYDNESNIFREGPNKSSLSTVMYKVNKKDFKLYKETIDESRKNKEMLESIFVKFFKNNYITLHRIGVEGYVSVDGIFISF